MIEILNALASATHAAFPVVDESDTGPAHPPMPEPDLDTAVRAHFAEADPDTGPVVAWALVAALDDAGREDDVIWVQAPDGQRGFVTTGLLHSALAVTDATSHHHEEDE